MTYVIDSKISADIVTLADAKLFLRVDFTEDDVLIQSLIDAAVSMAEKAMNRDLLTTTWINHRDSFTLQDLTLRRGEFQSLVQIEFLSDGSFVVLANTEYVVSIGGTFGVICEIDPPTIDNECNSVKITFKTGFGDDATFIPEDIKTAIKMDVTNMYNNRGDCSTTGCSKGLTPTSTAIYRSYRIIDAIGEDVLDPV